jgi:hypothetical protein
MMHASDVVMLEKLVCRKTTEIGQPDADPTIRIRPQERWSKPGSWSKVAVDMAGCEIRTV